MWLMLCLVAASVLSASGLPKIRGPLSEFITDYDTLSYSTSSLERQHGRHKRSADPDSSPIYLKFNAHRRKFHMRLRRDTSIFTDDFSTDVDFDPTKVVTGELVGRGRSRVHGFIHEGKFEGSIHTGDDHYYVESARKYFKKRMPFHSVIFHSNDIEYPYAYGSGCGVSKETREWMRKVQTSVVEEPSEDDNYGHSNNEPVLQRYRRAASSSVDPNKKVCTLMLQADHTFTANMAENNKEKAVLLMTLHVKGANDIYHATDFSNSGRANGISFMIARINVNDSSNAKDSSNPFRANNLGVEKILGMISQSERNQDFCLSYLFCYRDFDNGVLGLAWVGEAKGAAGGICEKYKSFSDGKKCLNTGVVSTLNYGKTVPQEVSTITFCHEAGHNFGSNHDDKPKCTPAGSEGNYIMFSRATSGKKPNNRLFSSCSKSSIYKVLESNGICTTDKCCFTSAKAAICGNRVVEKGEDCDCGYADEPSCGSDKCCEGKSAQGNRGCSFKQPSFTCSPSQGLCCDGNTCSPKPGNKTFACENSTSCRNVSYCNGINATCPLGPPKPDLTLCEGDRKICINGTCQGSICLKYGYQECQCTGEGRKCDVCCAVSSKPGEGQCKSTRDINGMQFIQQHPGSPCNSFNGYCDVFLKCRQVDADGPLNRLRKLFFSKEAILSYVQWVKTYWWAVVLIIVGLIIFMAGFIKLCSVHTPSSNPNRKPNRKLTLRRSQQGHGGGGRGGGGRGQRQCPSNARARARADNNEGYPGPSYAASYADPYADPPPPYAPPQPKPIELHACVNRNKPPQRH